MRTTSLKYEKEIIDAQRRRKAWHNGEPWYCRICHKRPGIEVHHIAGRNAKRCDLYEHPFNWLSLCGPCHVEYDKESPALIVCAAKLMADHQLPEDMREFDLERLKALRSGRRFAFTLAELQQACDQLEMMRRSL